MIAPARSVEPFDAQLTAPPAQPCGMTSAFPQFLTPALLGLFATPDNAAPPRVPDGGFFITQAEIADMDEAGGDEAAKGTPGNKQRESEASLLAWLPPAVIPAQASEALDSGAQAKTGAGVYCEPDALQDVGVPAAGPVDLSTPPASSASVDSANDSLPIDESHSADLEQGVAEPGVHNAARPLQMMSHTDQCPGDGDADGDGVASSIQAQHGSMSPGGEDKRLPLMRTDLVLPDSPTAGQTVFPKDPSSFADAYSRAKAEPGQAADKSVEHGPAPSIGRPAAAAPSRRSNRQHDTSEPADATPFKAAPSADTVPAAPAPTLPEFDSVEAPPAAGTRPDIIGPRGTAPLPSPESAETLSAARDMAGVDPQEGAPPASHIAKSPQPERTEPRIFAFGMRLTPSEGKAQSPGAQQTESSAGTQRHEPGLPARHAPLAEGAEQKSALKRGLPTDSNSEPVSSPQASAAAIGDSNFAPAQTANWGEESIHGIGVQERPTPEFHRGEATDSGTQGPVATHRAIHLQNKEADAPAATGPLREIKLELGGGGERVSVKLSERQGHVELAVHSRDAVLAGELRRDLPSLTAQIEQAGFRAEATRAGSNQAGDSRDGERWSEARDGAGQGGGRQHRHQNPDERKKEFKWLFPALGE